MRALHAAGGDSTLFVWPQAFEPARASDVTEPPRRPAYRLGFDVSMRDCTP